MKLLCALRAAIYGAIVLTVFMGCHKAEPPPSRMLYIFIGPIPGPAPNAEELRVYLADHLAMHGVTEPGDRKYYVALFASARIHVGRKGTWEYRCCVEVVDRYVVTSHRLATQKERDSQRIPDFSHGSEEEQRFGKACEVITEILKARSPGSNGSPNPERRETAES